jgi:hypothetical protein
MISTGTNAITTPASEKIVESNRPKALLMKAQSSSDNSDKKKTPGVLVKLHGKYAIAKKRKHVRI